MPAPGLHPIEPSAATMSQMSIVRTAIGLKRQGLLTANGGWYASHLGRFFNFKFGCFASELSLWMVYAQMLLELKGQLRFVRGSL